MKILKKAYSVLGFLYFLVLLPIVFLYFKADFGAKITWVFSFMLLTLLCALPASGFSVRRAKWFMLAIAVIQIPMVYLCAKGFLDGLRWNDTYYRFDPMIGLWVHGAVLLVGLILMLAGICFSRKDKHCNEIVSAAAENRAEKMEL